MSAWDFYDRFRPPSRPRAAKGGIRAQSQRGAFGENWWAKRWIAALEGFHIGARLQRGRRYARSGQVLSIEVAKGRIEARVQGSRPAPYKVEIQVKPLAAAAWKKVAAAAASQAVFASKLLGGAMPHEMEETFRAAGVTLFPERYHDLKTSCSCPDWSNPCKHIAAVYYLLGEEFDRDPFLIFRMRGLNRDEFMTLLGESGAPQTPEPERLPPERLPAAAERFYRGGALPEDLAGDVQDTQAGAAIARRLGKFPFWRGRSPLLEFLEDVYPAAASKARESLEGK
jgi:uncharacterized Zn finger protein